MGVGVVVVVVKVNAETLQVDLTDPPDLGNVHEAAPWPLHFSSLRKVVAPWARQKFYTFAEFQKSAGGAEANGPPQSEFFVIQSEFTDGETE